MKIERTKNSIKGILSGFLNKMVLLILPFFVKLVFINSLGMEYLGLNSLFVSLLNVLNLAELGFSSAVSFSMYRYIVSNDKKQICALLNLFKKIYLIIGSVIFIIGLSIAPFISFLCKGNIPNDINIYVLYLMYLLNTTISYLFFAYKSCILTSHHENYVVNNINTIVNIVLNVFQIIVLLVFKNYYLFVILLIGSTIVYNLLISLYVSKKYPEYVAYGSIDDSEKKDIYKKVKALFFYRVGGVVLSSIDSVVISYFLGLTVLGKYNGYYYVITALFGFFQIFSNALLGGIGNSIVTESVEKNKKDFENLNYTLGWIVCFCTTSLLCLYQTFIKLWIGKENLLSLGFVICLCIYFYVWKMMEVINLYKDGVGLWEKDKYRPIVASIFNLALNIILVQIIGIYGIVVSTILAIVIIIFPWSSYILYKNYFKDGYKKYLKFYFINFFVTIITCFITYFFCSFFMEYTLKSFIYCIIICIFVPNILLFLFYGWTKKFKETYIWLFNKLKFNKLINIINIGIKSLKYIYIICGCIILYFSFLIPINYKKEINYISKIKYVNFSIDDTIDIFYNLTMNENVYKSIFEEPTLNYLKYLHNKYGAKFTLYVFYEKDDFNLEKCPSKYLNEFEQNNNWLRFGFHGKNDYSDYSIDDIEDDYYMVNDALTKIVGKDSISDVIRLPFFHATRENVQKIINSKYPVKALLGADTINRADYYLNDEENKQLFELDTYYDEKDNITIYNTDIRVENMLYTWIDEDILQDEVLVIFTHEALLNEKNMFKIDYLLSILQHSSDVKYMFF